MAGPAVARREFVYEEAPFPSCHASTICELPDGGLLCAWFGGEREGATDVAIWASRKPEAGAWSVPAEVARADGVPCWNPVLHVTRRGDVLLFFKAGPSPQTWTGLLQRSKDGGASWSEAERLPAGILGPIKNKPFLRADGTLLCPSSVESWRAWACWVEITQDDPASWSKAGPVTIAGGGCIQPAIVGAPDADQLAMLCRTARIGQVMRAASGDGGRTWSEGNAIDLPHNNSGLDAATLPDGRVALVYNHTTSGRTPLNIAFSNDLGASFDPDTLTLEDEPGEYSYPAVVSSQDGVLHVSYTWRRQRIAYARIET